MSRLQLALNVSDLETGIDFYSKLFGSAPAKVRDGYANFEVADPPLKLVLFENPQAKGRLNHLGIEVDTTDEVGAAAARLTSEGLPASEPAEQTCCHAVQDKTYVADPDGEPWEIYVVKADAEEFGHGTIPIGVGTNVTTSASTCCG